VRSSISGRKRPALRGTALTKVLFESSHASHVGARVITSEKSSYFISPGIGVRSAGSGLLSTGNGRHHRFPGSHIAVKTFPPNLRSSSSMLPSAVASSPTELSAAASPVTTAATPVLSRTLSAHPVSSAAVPLPGQNGNLPDHPGGLVAAPSAPGMAVGWIAVNNVGLIASLTRVTSVQDMKLTCLRMALLQCLVLFQGRIFATLR
jgi:hypothetical protein